MKDTMSVPYFAVHPSKKNWKRCQGRPFCWCEKSLEVARKWKTGAQLPPYVDVLARNDLQGEAGMQSLGQILFAPLRHFLSYIAGDDVSDIIIDYYGQSYFIEEKSEGSFFRTENPPQKLIFFTRICVYFTDSGEYSDLYQWRRDNGDLVQVTRHSFRVISPSFKKIKKYFWAFDDAIRRFDDALRRHWLHFEQNLCVWIDNTKFIRWFNL